MTEAKTGQRPLRAWRAACRQEAAEQAAYEARSSWEAAGVHGVTPFEHRWEHVQAVVRLAALLAVELKADIEIVEASAWLHDIRKSEPDHANVGACATEQFLAETDFPPEKIGAVADAIRQHVGLVRPFDAAPLQPLEAAILWDADKLSKLGVMALAFVLSAHYSAGMSLTQRRRDIEKFVRKVLAETVTSMNTEPARRMAQQRYAAMLEALSAWEQEERI